MRGLSAPFRKRSRSNQTMLRTKCRGRLPGNLSTATTCDRTPPYTISVQSTTLGSLTTGYRGNPEARQAERQTKFQQAAEARRMYWSSKIAPSRPRRHPIPRPFRINTFWATQRMTQITAYLSSGSFGFEPETPHVYLKPTLIVAGSCNHPLQNSVGWPQLPEALLE